MKCQERDTELLLYQLGELSFARHWAVNVHLITCERCRKRQQELAGVSGKIASALRNPTSSGAASRPISPLRSLPIVSMLAMLVVLVVLGIFIIGKISSRNNPVSNAVQKEDGCRPDITSDKCK